MPTIMTAKQLSTYDCCAIVEGLGAALQHAHHVVGDAAHDEGPAPAVCARLAASDRYRLGIPAPRLVRPHRLQPDPVWSMQSTRE